jgi:hypothetical protein
MSRIITLRILRDGNRCQVAESSVEEWVQKIKTHTRNRSNLSIRAILTFFLKTCIPAMGRKMDQWPEEPSKIMVAKLNNDDLIRSICGKSTNAKRKFQWLTMICTYVVPWVLPAAANPDMFDDSSDICKGH